MSLRGFLTFLGWLAAAAFLAAGAPLLLRMPLWCDVTLYDVAARSLLNGGVLYRDVFDTNPPGFVWVLCGLRAAFGMAPEVIRIADLAIVVVVTGALLAWAKRAGATGLGLSWTAAAIAAFYPFIHEFNHAQRDVWMMLPALAALALRMRRLQPPSIDQFSSNFWAESNEKVIRYGAGSISTAVIEGLLWGLGCWIKPHLFLVAAAAWLATAPRFSSWRLAFRDLAAVLAGGLLAGAGGGAWLVHSGAWPHFIEVWRNWNASYLDVVRRELPYRIVNMQLAYFPPYSVGVLLAVPLALCNLRGCTSLDPARFRRGMLAAVYLGWLATALLFQRPFHYVHIPETLLMLALFAANRWPIALMLVAVQVAVAAALLHDDGARAAREVRETYPRSRWIVDPNPALDPARFRWWAGCFEPGPPRELRKGVALYADHFGGIDPVELGAVADYLRALELCDGELIAWHDSPHALYLELGIRPGFRFMHVGTVWGLGPRQREMIFEELRAALPRARFAVSDMHRITARRDELAAADWEKLLPAWQREHFPFDQPVVFRSPGGRYLVHRIEKPVAGCAIPETLDQASPPKGG